MSDKMKNTIENSWPDTVRLDMIEKSEWYGFFAESDILVVDSNQVLSETQALRLAKHIFRSQE